MIRVQLPRDRRYCGTLAVLGESGDVIFGPVPVGAQPQTPHGAYQVGDISRECAVVLLDAGETTLAIQGQSQEYGDDIYETSGGLRLAHRNMEVLLNLLDVYDPQMPCTIAEGPATAMRVATRDGFEQEPDEIHVRRVNLARRARQFL